MSTLGAEIVPFWAAASLVRESNGPQGRVISMDGMESWTGKLTGVESDSTASGTPFQRGDVLFGKLRPYLAKSWLADESGTAQGDIHVYRPHASTHPEYLAYIIRSREFVRFASAASEGVKMPRVEWSKLRSYDIPLPDLPTQRRIADYLDRETAQIDAMAAALDGLVARLEERRTSIIEHSVTGRIGGGVQGGAGVSPTPMAPLGALCHLVAGGTPSSSDSRYWESSGEAGTPWVSIGDMSRRKWVTSTSRRVSDAGLSAARLPTAPAGTVLFAMYASVGETAILNFPASWNQALLGVAPYDDSKLSATYLYYALLTLKPELPLFYRSNTQNNLNAETVARFRIPLPDLPTQRRIADHLDEETAKIDAMIAKAGELRVLLDERRSALITATVTGQHPVPEEP